MGRPSISVSAVRAGRSASISSPCSPLRVSVPMPQTRSPMSPSPLLPHSLGLRLLIVRHAETESSASRPRMVQGQNDSALTVNGTKQAHAIAHRLAKEKIDFIYSSDLGRARQTANLIAKAQASTSAKEDKVVPEVLLEPRLREQHLGALAGQQWNEVKKFLRERDETYDEYLSRHSPPAETSAVLKARVESVYVDIVDRHLLAPHGISITRSDPSSQNALPKSSTQDPSPIKRPQVILVVTHGGPIVKLIRHLLDDLGFRAPEVLTSRFPRLTGLYEVQLDYRAGTWTGTLALFNCVAHLAGLSSYVLQDDKLIRDPETRQRKLRFEEEQRKQELQYEKQSKDQQDKENENESELKGKSGSNSSILARLRNSVISSGNNNNNNSGSNSNSSNRGGDGSAGNRVRRSLGW